MAGPVRAQPGIYRAFKGTVLHLYLPGFHLASYARSASPVGLCGTQAWDGWKAPAIWFDSPPVLGLPYRWCGKCVGIALVHFGGIDDSVKRIAPHFSPEVAHAES